MAKVVAVNVSEKKGTIKHAVEEVEMKEDFGIVGDSHAEQGSIRQISLLGIESINKMKEYGIGLCVGKFAENVTTEGICLYELPVGTKLKIGETLHEVTQIGKKCHAGDGCEIAKLTGKCIMPKEGIFARVLKGGIVRAGDEIVIEKSAILKLIKNKTSGLCRLFFSLNMVFCKLSGNRDHFYRVGIARFFARRTCGYYNRIAGTQRRHIVYRSLFRLVKQNVGGVVVRAHDGKNAPGQSKFIPHRLVGCHADYIHRRAEAGNHTDGRARI